jgi:VanZ family protein
VKTKKALQRKRVAVCAADVLWLGTVFSQSLRDAQTSAQHSGQLTLLLQEGLHTDRPVDALERLVRKLAHFAEFFLLGVLIALTLAAFGLLLQKSGAVNRHGIAYAALAGVLPALCDETLQLTRAGRAALVGDVWLDWAGYLCGLVFCLFCAKTVVKSVKKRYDKKQRKSDPA